MKNDPQHLLYHFPSIHPVRYTQLYSEYHFWRNVELAEHVAAMFNRLLVPSRLIHWERKSKFADRCVRIGRKSFYALSKDELTEREYSRYLDEVRQAEEAEMEVVHA